MERDCSVRVLTNEEFAVIARALSHPARVRIVQLLAETHECVAGEIFDQLELAQSTVSEHLRVLRDAGLVNFRTVGTSTVYCVVSDRVRLFGDNARDLVRQHAGCAFPSSGDVPGR